MPMRHPLKDLPLDLFLHLEHRTSSKRPLSPSTALLSPSKRRILSAEGLYSPEKRGNSTPSSHLFSEFVTSPSSPAKRLDFAALSHPTPRQADALPARDASSPHTPSQRADDAPKLAPSPEIASSSASDTALGLRRCNPTSGSPCSSNRLQHMLIPREMPTFSDRHSIHWPGFDVHPDTYIAIPTSEAHEPTPDASDKQDEDIEKENIKPRRRGKKSILEATKLGKTVTLPRAENHTQESGDVHIMPILAPSPQKKTLDPREKEQERRRNMLIMVREQDQDQEGNEEEDVDQQL